MDPVRDNWNQLVSELKIWNQLFNEVYYKIILISNGVVFAGKSWNSFPRKPRLIAALRAAIPPSGSPPDGEQNRKIFVSLIEKNFGGRKLKNVKKTFLLGGER